MNNNDETMNAVKQFLTMFFSMLTIAVPALANSQQYSLLTTGIMTTVPALFTLGSIAWSIYSHWNMKKVPEAATALLLPNPSPPAGTVVDLAPMKGMAKVVGALLVGFLLLNAVPAFAQTKKAAPNLDPLGLFKGGPGTTAQTIAKGLDPVTVWKRIVAAVPADLIYAKALADNVNTPNSELRSACYAALITANSQANGVGLKDAAGAPLVEPADGSNAISEFEKVAEAIDNLQPTAPITAKCAPAANALGLEVLGLVNALVTGAALKAIPGIGAILP